MSAFGIGPQAGAVRDLWPARAAGSRAFAKPTPARGTIAMDLASAKDPPRATFEARRGVDAPGDGPSFGALLLRFDASATLPLARREGYPEPAWRRLLDAAGPRGLPALLLDLARGTGDDVVAYRRALREVAGPSDLDAYHYLPHPVLTDAEPALCFVAPERGETGDPTCGAAKAATPHLRPLRLDRLYAEAPRVMSAFSAEAQATYVDKCLRAAAHGLCVRDLLGDGLLEGDPTARMFAAWRADPSVLEAEREALRALVPGIRDRAAYARRFPQAGAPLLA
jgi:hypothetical protein